MWIQLSDLIENIVGKEKIASNEQFLLFPQCFHNLSVVDALTLFLRVCSTSLLKALWEKEKLLVTSSFSFSCNVFYPFEELSAIFIKFEIVVCKKIT